MSQEHDMIHRLRGAETDARSAFESLFKAYYTRLCAIADAYTGAPQSSEEVVADVFVWLWEHRTTWNPTTSIEVYLISAVRNRARNTIRDVRLRERLLDQHGAIDLPVGQPPESAQLHLERADRATALITALKSLSPLPRLIITLRWQRQLSWEEISTALGVSIAAAQMQHTRAIRTLKELLHEPV